MLFIVPDEEAPLESDSKQATNEEAPEATGKSKVELDLDDAPFLEEEPAAVAAPAQSPEPAPESPSSEEEKPKKQSFIKRLLENKKKLIMIGGGVTLLIIIIVVLLLFMGGEKKEEVQEVEEVQEKIEEKIEEKVEEAPEAEVAPIIFKVENGTEETPTILPYKFLIDWEPFLVPLHGAEGEIRLLHCKVAIPVDDEGLHTELQNKKSVLRDAVYYYLSHRPMTLLDTPEVQEAFKRDIINVINERVISAKLKDLLVQDYLVQGP